MTEKSHTKECLILTSLTSGKHLRVLNHSRKEVALTSFNHIDKKRRLKRKKKSKTLLTVEKIGKMSLVKLLKNKKQHPTLLLTVHCFL